MYARLQKKTPQPSLISTKDLDSATCLNVTSRGLANTNMSRKVLRALRGKGSEHPKHLCSDCSECSGQERRKHYEHAKTL